MNYYKIKYDKYISKLDNISNIYYYFNTYGKSIPVKYMNILNTIKLKKATDKQYLQIRLNADELAKDDYYSHGKLTIGSFNMNFTIFSLTENKVNSVIKFIISDNGYCYIETFCCHNMLLLNLLKEICYDIGISKIQTFSIYQPETDFLLKNCFFRERGNLLVCLIS